MFIESTTQSSANIDALFRKTRLKRYSVAAEAIKKAGCQFANVGAKHYFYRWQLAVWRLSGDYRWCMHDGRGKVLKQQWLQQYLRFPLTSMGY